MQMGQNKSVTKIQMRQNSNRIYFKWDIMQMQQNESETNCKYNKMQMRQNENRTKFKWDMQI